MRIVFLMSRPVNLQAVRNALADVAPDANVYHPVGLDERLNIWVDDQRCSDPREVIVRAQRVIGPRGELATVV